MKTAIFFFFWLEVIFQKLFHTTFSIVNYLL